MSNKEITQKCGSLDKMRYGDKIMADRRFNISEDLAHCGVRHGLQHSQEGNHSFLKVKWK